MGDISCLNFCKGLFGMGGMFLTSNQPMFEKAVAIHNTFPLRSKKIIPFRLIRNFLQRSIRSQASFDRYYKFMSFAEKLSQRSDSNEDNYYEIPYENLVRPLTSEANYTWYMLNKHWQKNKTGRQRIFDYYKNNITRKTTFEILGNPLKNSLLTRLYIKAPDQSNELIKQLFTEHNIECKHLSQDYRSPYQKFLGDIQYFRKNAIWTNCSLTKELNDELLSVPFYPSISYQEIDYVIKAIKSI